MTAAELAKAKWAATLLLTGRANDARDELLELIAATEKDRPDLLATRVPVVGLKSLDGVST